MTEPMHDMDLHRHHYLREVALDVYPLRRMTSATEPGEWTHYTPPPPKRRWWHSRRRGQYWTVTRPVCLHLPGVRLLTCHGAGWSTEPGAIRLEAGYRFDGASGGAFNDPAALMGAAVHDVVCTRLETDAGWTHPLPGYTARHTLYARIVRAQGSARWRACVDWVGLMAANWALDLFGRRETPR